jgi:hypothetical protein
MIEIYSDELGAVHRRDGSEVGFRFASSANFTLLRLIKEESRFCIPLQVVSACMRKLCPVLVDAVNLMTKNKGRDYESLSFSITTRYEAQEGNPQDFVKQVSVPGLMTFKGLSLELLKELDPSFIRDIQVKPKWDDVAWYQKVSQDPFFNCIHEGQWIQFSPFRIDMGKMISGLGEINPILKSRYISVVTQFMELESNLDISSNFQYAKDSRSYLIQRYELLLFDIFRAAFQNFLEFHDLVSAIKKSKKSKKGKK